MSRDIEYVLLILEINKLRFHTKVQTEEILKLIIFECMGLVLVGLKLPS